MIFKILPGSSTFHGVDYNEKKLLKGTAELLHFDGFGHYQLGKQKLSAKQYKEYLTLYSDRNIRVWKPQFHAMLSCKGKEHSH